MAKHGKSYRNGPDASPAEWCLILLGKQSDEVASSSIQDFDSPSGETSHRNPKNSQL